MCIFVFQYVYLISVSPIDLLKAYILEGLLIL